ARYSASPSMSASLKHRTSAPGTCSDSQTSTVCSLSAARVCAATSSGGSATASTEVVNTTESSPAPAGVATWVPAGTTIVRVAGAESQNVTSVRATLGGNGSTPTRLRKCTYSRSGTWLT